MQVPLDQEEQKSASLKEKLNVAVRKGKSLVQHRDSLKQAVEEMNTKVEHLKSEIEFHDNALAEYEQKIKYLSTYLERVEALESEILLLRNHLTEAEYGPSPDPPDRRDSLLKEKKEMKKLVFSSFEKPALGEERCCLESPLTFYFCF